MLDVSCCGDVQELLPLEVVWAACCVQVRLLGCWALSVLVMISDV